ncbi:hypothetical protein TNCV_2495111 [Trichonephila clavipes]|nr:hypothetical protein TNCV_2495111 [Trichonephila clavipes]
MIVHMAHHSTRKYEKAFRIEKKWADGDSFRTSIEDGRKSVNRTYAVVPLSFLHVGEHSKGPWILQDESTSRISVPLTEIRVWPRYAEWYRYRIVAGFVTSSRPLPLKTRGVGQRCTLNLSRAETSSRWGGS